MTGVSRIQPKIAEALRLLQASSCFHGEVCGSPPCACAETLAAMAMTPPTPSAQTVTARATRFAIDWGASGTYGAMLAEFAIRETATLTSSLTAAEARVGELADLLREALDYEKEAANFRGFSDCTCMSHSRTAETAYESGKCPHQKGRAALSQTEEGR